MTHHPPTKARRNFFNCQIPLIKVARRRILILNHISISYVKYSPAARIIHELNNNI